MSDKVNRALVILSGGQDSTTCLYWAKEHFEEVHAVTFNYGQRHARELEAARTVAALAGISGHEIVDVGPILRGTSPLVSDAALEQYPDYNSLPGGLEKTFVPMRNLLFITLAANIAYCKDIPNLVTGVCEEDFGGYPDCRQMFIDAAQDAIRKASEVDFTIHTPLMNLTKAASVLLADSLKGCMAALAYTHTAYDGAYPPTGHDHATLLRAKGFAEAGMPDPLIVRAWREGLMALPETENYAGLHPLTLTQVAE